MGAGSFLTGLVSGNVEEATKMKKGDKKGLLRRGKKKPKKPIMDDSGGSGIPIGQFKKGGKVKRTGIYKLHKRERVLTAKQSRRYRSKKR